MTISFARHQFPPAIIQYAVWLYLRFTLSYRDVEDLLAERGLDVSYETVRVGSHLGLRISNFAPKKPSNVRICLVDILTFDGLASSLELQAGPSRIGATSSSPPIVGRRIYEKVGASNSQIKWLQQAILSN